MGHDRRERTSPSSSKMVSLRSGYSAKRSVHFHIFITFIIIILCILLISGYNYAINEVDIEEQKDKEDFIKLMDMLLWDEDQTNLDEGRGFFRRRGLMRRTMPVYLQRQDNYAGSMYRSFQEACFSLACKIGLNGLATSLRRLMS